MNLFNCVYPSYKSICPHVHGGTSEKCSTPNKGLRNEEDVANRQTCHQRYGVEDAQKYAAYTGKKQLVAIIGTIASAVLAVAGAVVAGLIVASILSLTLPFLIGAAVVSGLALASTGIFAHGWHAASGERQAALAKIS